MIEIWHSCGRRFLDLRGAVGRPMSSPAGPDDWIFTAPRHTVGRRIRTPVASYVALAVGQCQSAFFRLYLSKASGAGEVSVIVSCSSSQSKELRFRGR